MVEKSDVVKTLSQPLKIGGVVQDYAWGKGADSLVAKLAHEKKERAHYAELWFGAHSKASSPIMTKGASSTLLELLRKGMKSEQAASLVPESEGLLFLLKVLSIERALSIQAHPDKARAEILHRENPAQYPDMNHKPELAIALSEATLLYGFRDLKSIYGELGKIPSLQEIAENTSQGLRNLFHLLVMLPRKKIEEACNELVSLVRAGVFQKSWTPIQREAFLRTALDFPRGDIGLLCFILLNFVELRAGQGVFVGPNIPHAYLSGDLLECMANSDNVVRLGLTEKYRDIDTLREMLSYETQLPILILPKQEGKRALYQVPARDFSCAIAALAERESEKIESGHVSIVLALEGKYEVSTHGNVCFSLSPGEAAFLSRGLKDVIVTANEAGRVVIASEGF